MIPLVSVKPELEKLRALAEEVIAEVAAAEGVELEIPIGTMIELPRAAVTANEIAQAADFFSFGTNDLTQTTFGFSRDDVESEFVPQYLADASCLTTPSLRSIRVLRSSLRWALSSAMKAILISFAAFAASMVAILILLRSSTASVSTMFPAHRIACRWLAWLLLRLRWQTNNFCCASFVRLNAKHMKMTSFGRSFFIAPP